jgi:hypothetical protein
MQLCTSVIFLVCINGCYIFSQYVAEYEEAEEDGDNNEEI